MRFLCGIDWGRTERDRAEKVESEKVPGKKTRDPEVWSRRLAGKTGLGGKDLRGNELSVRNVIEKKLKVEEKVLSGVLCRVRSLGNLSNKAEMEEIHCI